VIDDIRQLLVLPPQRSCTLAILAIPSEITPERFCQENLPAAEFGHEIAHRFVMRQYCSFYTLVIHFKGQVVADKLFYAFNGRFFGEKNPETMHTIFLSEPVLFKKSTNLDSLEAEELHLLERYHSQHQGTHFDRLPLCPLCIEKMDTSVTG